MTKINAQIIAHSKNELGDELVTFILTLPRIILAEGKTHRLISGMLEEVSIGLNDEEMFSRNSASSRAIPFNKMVESVLNDPFIPIAWQKEHKGMQGVEYHTDEDSIAALVSNHLSGRDYAIACATEATNLGCTKQIANRYLEPFMWHTVIVTTGKEGLENFFDLRCPQYEDVVGLKYKSRKDFIKNYPDVDNASELDWLIANKGLAEIHMMVLAEAMYDAYNESIPRILEAGEWHVPYKNEIDYLYPEAAKRVDVLPNIPIYVLISSVMCARVSYTVAGHELSEWTVSKYIDKALELANAKPLHASPFEHTSCSMTNREYKEVFTGNDFKEDGWCRNFRGFIQLRHILENRK